MALNARVVVENSTPYASVRVRPQWWRKRWPTLKSSKACPFGHVLARARTWPKGHAFEDFSVGQRFRHHWGRTLTEAYGVLFSTTTLAFKAIFFNRELVRANGHPRLVINATPVYFWIF